MDAFLLSAVRTPTGKFLGELAELSAPRLGSFVIAEAMKRAGLDPAQIDEVIMGEVLQAGVGQNPARQAALAAGLPNTVPAYTVNKVCGSGLKAVMLAAQAIRAGDADLIVAGGMESMSNAPHLMTGARQGWKYGEQKVLDAIVQDGLWCPFEKWSMGNAAEHTASMCGITRLDQDRFSTQSHQRAAKAWADGAFDAEVLPITVGSGAKQRTVNRDEGIRAETSVEGLAKLRPAFATDGTVTAANASQLSDGAAAVVVASGQAVERLNAKPLARIIAYTTSGVAPKEIFTAPIPAIRQVLDKAKIASENVDLFELNEAFAAQMLACGKELRLDESKLNIHGGGIALGHPIGASGARVLVTLLHALQRHQKRIGVASLCLGGGNAVAMVIERMTNDE